MGTTMAFYNILNRAFTPDELQKKMLELSNSEYSSNDKMLEVLLPTDLLNQMREHMNASATNINEILGAGTQFRSERAVIAYNESAKWLPFFEVNHCEGNTASSKDAGQLSTIFNTPVIVFSIFDSDILFVSYSDAAKGIFFDYAKPNFEEFEEFDTEMYSTEFPEFLLDYCCHDGLKEIWDNPDEVFADDRMYKICELIQALPLCNSNDIPEGYQAIYAT